MHTSKFAKMSANPWRSAVPPDPKRYTKLFSSILDIGELLQVNCSHRHELNGAGPQFHHRRVKIGELIYRLGQPFESLYIVRFGFVKTVLRNAEGDERVLTFSMKGSLLGFDGIHDNHYCTEAIALTDGELVVIPFEYLLGTKCFYRELETMIYMAISREFTEEHAGISLSSSLKSEARVAYFLEELAKRYAAIGYSSREFSLPMTRRDIGCYLGLSLETVSRSFSTLALLRIIAVHRQHIKILDPELLHRFHTSPLTPVQKARNIRSLSLNPLRLERIDKRSHLFEMEH
jgi:CRP/FNR family transcriptional regulator